MPPPDLLPQFDAPIFLANRVVDSIFIGGAMAAEDHDFMLSNGVTHVINCAATEVQNRFQSLGISYLSYAWPRSDNAQLFDRPDVLGTIFEAIKRAREDETCLLVHSYDGTSRSVIVLAAYLIHRYHWHPQRTLQFIATKRYNINPRPALVKQLMQWASKLRAQRGTEFRDIFSADLGQVVLEDEEWVHRNSFLNSVQAQPSPPKLNKRARLRELLARDEFKGTATVKQQTTPKMFRWSDGHRQGQVEVSQLPPGNPSLFSKLIRPPNPGYSSTLPVISLPRPISLAYVPERPPSPAPPADFTPPKSTPTFAYHTGSQPLAPPISILTMQMPHTQHRSYQVVVEPEDAVNAAVVAAKSVPPPSASASQQATQSAAPRASSARRATSARPDQRSRSMIVPPSPVTLTQSQSSLSSSMVARSSRQAPVRPTYGSSSSAPIAVLPQQRTQTPTSSLPTRASHVHSQLTARPPTPPRQFNRPPTVVQQLPSEVTASTQRMTRPVVVSRQPTVVAASSGYGRTLSQRPSSAQRQKPAAPPQPPRPSSAPRSYGMSSLGSQPPTAPSRTRSYDTGRPSSSFTAPISSYQRPDTGSLSASYSGTSSRSQLRPGTRSYSQNSGARVQTSHRLWSIQSRFSHMSADSSTVAALTPAMVWSITRSDSGNPVYRGRPVCFAEFVGVLTQGQNQGLDFSAVLWDPSCGENEHCWIQIKVYSDSTPAYNELASNQYDSRVVRAVGRLMPDDSNNAFPDWSLQTQFIELIPESQIGNYIALHQMEAVRWVLTAINGDLDVELQQPQRQAGQTRMPVGSVMNNAPEREVPEELVQMILGVYNQYPSYSLSPDQIRQLLERDNHRNEDIKRINLCVQQLMARGSIQESGLGAFTIRK